LLPTLPARQLAKLMAFWVALALVHAIRARINTT